MNPHFEPIGTQFVQQYYSLFDAKTTREGVMALYHPDCLMTFEGTQIQGLPKIAEKIREIPLDNLSRVVTKADCHPTPDGGVLVMIVGQLKNSSEGDKPLGFSQVFLLRPHGGSFYIQSDIFRLAVHDI